MHREVVASSDPEEPLVMMATSAPRTSMCTAGIFQVASGRAIGILIAEFDYVAQCTSPPTSLVLEHEC